MSQAGAQGSETNGVEVLFETGIQEQPCCLEFSRAHPDFFVVGTYDLEDATTQSRKGSISLYRLYDHQLTLHDTVVYPSGVLDIHFSQALSDEKFAVASSTGSVSIFKIQSYSSIPRIVLLNDFQVFSNSTLVLSLTWHNSPDGPIAVSSSTGEVRILNFVNGYTELNDNALVNSHQNNEAWTVAFSIDEDHLGYLQGGDLQLGVQRLNEGRPLQPSISGIYSGGDDGRLRFVAFSRDRVFKTVLKPAHDAQPGGVNGLGGHNAGVTAILPLPLPTRVGKDILITGSYDDYVRVYAMYDYRPEQANFVPKVLAKLCIGGGVWRLRLLRTEVIKPREYSFRVLASCMQAGARILEVKGSLNAEWTITVLSAFTFNTPDILNYAGDAQPSLISPDSDSGANEQKIVCVSANFYGKQLYVWSPT